MTDVADVLRIYTGSNGDATKALYVELVLLGPAGAVAMNLFRACKASERAKVYRRGWKGVAYDKKQWSMGQLCELLVAEAEGLGIRWGWGIDTKQPVHMFVLYIDLPDIGQVSFHTAERCPGPDYPGEWDGREGQSADRICRFVGWLLAKVEA